MHTSGQSSQQSPYVRPTHAMPSLCAVRLRLNLESDFSQEKSLFVDAKLESLIPKLVILDSLN
jgi:hypothetical protein